jgi:hypothetical protein
MHVTLFLCLVKYFNTIFSYISPSSKQSNDKMCPMLGKIYGDIAIKIFTMCRKKHHMRDICALDNGCEKPYKIFVIYDRLFPLEKRKEKEPIFLSCISVRETFSKQTVFPQFLIDILLRYTCPVMQWQGKN